MFTGMYKVILMGVLATAFITYSIILYSATPLKSTKVSPETARGKLLWQQYNCNSCHQVYGLGGYLGPDLTNVYSRRGEGYITSFLKNGTNIMPNFDLKDHQIKELLEFLKNLDSSGKSDPRTFTINKNGTISQK